MQINNIYNIDCIQGIQQLENQSIDLVLIDPPYFKVKGDFDFALSFQEWKNLHYQLALEIKRVCKLSANIIIWGGHMLHEQVIIFNQFFYYLQKCVWHKIDGIGNLQRVNKHCRKPPTLAEFFILYALHDDQFLRRRNLNRVYNNIYKHSNIYSYSQQSNITQKYAHPTQKPEKLTSNLIEVLSNEQQNILIPFVGSGTECAMAKKLNRNFIGFELDKKYFDIALNRINTI